MIGDELRTIFLNTKSFNVSQKKKDLQSILHINEKAILKKVHKFPNLDGWDRFGLETSDEKLIPVLFHPPSGNVKEFVIICNPDGKSNISVELILRLIKSGRGIAIADLTGTGEASFNEARINYSRGRLRILARSEMWLGKTVLGEWVNELSVVTQFLKSGYNAQIVSIDGRKEAGLAGLFLSALESTVNNITLRDAPVSYLFDQRESVDYFSMGIHLPGLLVWGDVSLAAALSGTNIIFVDPVTMSGQKLSKERLNEYISEFEKVRKACRQPGKTLFLRGIDSSFVK